MLGALRPAIFYDNMTYDEIGIMLAAKRRGMNMEGINFQTTVNMLNSLNEFSPVINRCQSKARREKASFIVEEGRGSVINAFEVEMICNSKIFTISRFARSGIGTLRTAYVPFAGEKEGERILLRMGDVDSVIKKVEIMFKYPFVVKPERGSRGRSVVKIEDRVQFENILKSWTRSLDSPAGLLIQDCLSKAFDLRMVVASYDGKEHKFLASLARVPSSQEAFATNTALGAIPVGVELPTRAKEEAIRASMVISNRTSVLGVDAIPGINEEDMERVIEHAKNVVPIHNRVKRVKETFSNSVKLSLEKFLKTKENLDYAFKEMIMASEYIKLKNLLEELLDNAELYFIEVNSRPDFYVNTRNCTGVDISEAYAKCIEALT